jgi:hypothetical protein
MEIQMKKSKRDTQKKKFNLASRRPHHYFEQ